MAHDPHPASDPLPLAPAAPSRALPAAETAPQPTREPGALSAWEQPRDAAGDYVQVARRELRALTSLRFFAAVYVVVHHLVNVGLLHAQGAGADRSATWYLAWATQGHVGVTFFFVLSGFILAWCYHHAFGTRDAGQARPLRRRFWLARFARVWPLHAATFLLFVPIALLGAGSGIAALGTTAWQGVLNIALLHAWVPAGGADGLSDTFNSPSWTLSVEAFFYLAFPAVAVLLVRRLRWGVAQLGLLAAASWLALGSLGLALADAPAGEWAMRVLPLARFPDFLVGVVLGLVVVQRHQRATVSGTAVAVGSRRRWTVVEAAVLAAACASPLVWALGASRVLPDTLGTSWFHLPAIAAAILVLSLERGAISTRLLSVRPLVWLGEVSYALYLVHWFIILVAYRVGAYGMVGPWVASLLLLALSIVAAGIVHERFEKPARSRIVRRLGRS